MYPGMPGMPNQQFNPMMMQNYPGGFPYQYNQGQYPMPGYGFNPGYQGQPYG